MSRPRIPRVPRDARAWIEVDHGALAANARAIRRVLAPGASLMAIVKADAYGHGAARVAPTLAGSGAESFGVATVEEGVELREAGIRSPILVLGYVRGVECVEALVEWGLSPTISSLRHGRELAAALARLRSREAIARRQLPLDVHLKLDTGMSRLGARWSAAGRVLAAIGKLRMLRVRGVYSHLASADVPGSGFTAAQCARFRRALEVLGTIGPARARGIVRHVANSAATLASPSLHLDLVRVGIALYGISPAPHLEHRVALRPALSIRSRITEVKRVPAGTPVSYGGTWVAPGARRLAVVSIGYADGVPGRLSGRLEGLIGGRRVRQVGRITMDQLVVDATGLPAVRPGSEITLLGRDGEAEIRVEHWARWLESIPWEVLCLFKSRLPRVETSLLPRSPDSFEARTPPSPQRSALYTSHRIR